MNKKRHSDYLDTDTKNIIVNNATSNSSATSNDLLLVKALNKFMFYFFLSLIILLNILCFFVFPYYVQEQLTLDSK